MKIFWIMMIILNGSYSSFAIAKQDVLLWRHHATHVEIETSLAAIERFNQSQNKWNIIASTIPEHSYTQSIQAAEQADLLPCVIEVDQPIVANFAWQGIIQPIDELIDQQLLNTIDNLGKGIYKDRVYSLGPLDVSLALFTKKSLIKSLGVRYPTLEKPWDKNELIAFLDAVKKTNEYRFPFDMQANNRTEWIPYAWGALMLSSGADLINRNDNQTVDGVLNSKQAIAFAQWIQQLVSDNYIDANSSDNKGFINGEVALQYGGSWDLTAYYNTYKEDLAILPLPDLGYGTVSGAGGWHWAITETCQFPNAANELISFLMSPEEQSAMAKVMGIFPIGAEAAEFTESYGNNGEWRIFYEFSKKFGKKRPETPAYSEISDSYKNAMINIVNGMQPELALDLAVERIEAAFSRHHNYQDR